MSADPSLACGVLNKLGKFWLDMRFTDLVVTVDQIPFHCHKFHLCACSAFFDALLNTENADGSKNSINHVIITGISSTTFESVLRTIYKGENVLDENNMTPLWYASKQLQVDLLVAKCEDFVTSHLTVDNFENTYLNAVCLESSAVLDSVLKFMANNFEHFRQTPTFLDLPMDHLKIIVDKFPKIPKSYDSLVSSIVLWASHVTADDVGDREQKSDVSANVSTKYNEGKLKINTAETRAAAAENVSAETDAELTFMVPPLSITEESSRLELRGILRCYPNQDRHQCLGNLLETAQLERASADYLKSLTNYEWLMGIKEARDVVWNAVVEQRRVQGNPAAKSVNSPSNLPNSSGSRCAMLYKPIGESEGPYAYCLDTDKLYRVRPSGVYRFLGSLHSVSNDDPQPICQLLITKDNRSSAILLCPGLSYGQYALSLDGGCCSVYHGGFFYCLKGNLIYRTQSKEYTGSKILHRCVWSIIGQLDNQTKPQFSAVLNEIMYVFAGCTSDANRNMTQIHCFDLTSLKPVRCQALINACTNSLLTFTYNDKLFILQATGELYRLDHTTQAHFSVSPFYKQCDDGEAYDEEKKLWNHMRFNDILGVVVYNNELVVFVQTDVTFPELRFLPLGLSNIRFIELLSHERCYVTYKNLNMLMEI